MRCADRGDQHRQQRVQVRSSPVRPETLVATSLDLRLPTTTAPCRGCHDRRLRRSAPRPPLESSPPTVSTQLGENGSTPTPVAVSVSDSFVITHRRAVPSGRTSITLAGADGQPHDVDGPDGRSRPRSRRAVEPTRPRPGPYGIGPRPWHLATSVTVLGALPTSANVSVDAAGRLTLDAWADSMAEGTPVVNADGLLVGMCSHGSAGPSWQRGQRALPCCTRSSRRRPHRGWAFMSPMAIDGAPATIASTSTGRPLQPASSPATPSPRSTARLSAAVDTLKAALAEACTRRHGDVDRHPRRPDVERGRDRPR